MKNNLLFFLLGAGVTFAIMLVVSNRTSAKFKAKIEALEIERLQLQKQQRQAREQIDALNIELELNEQLRDTIREKITIIRSQRDEAQNNINSMRISELDSILTNYRHPRRE